MRFSINSYLSGLVFTLLLAGAVSAQNPLTIKLKKESGYILFFQKSAKSDTIVKNKNDLFYLLVPDSIKESTVFSIENGQLITTGNDSLVKLNYLTGLKYDFSYEADKKPAQFNQGRKKNQNQKTGSYKTLINGTCDLSKGKINVQIINRHSGKLIYELFFWYSPSSQ